MNEIIEKIIKWGNDKGINNPDKQFNKLAEEMLEAHEEYVVVKTLDEIANIIDEENYRMAWIELSAEHSTKLAIELGDIGVVWLLLCNMLDVSPRLALELAHEKNKDRKGKTINGNFIKEEDL